MKAIIMAGGEGSRLRPLTCDCPKPMLPLLGKPLMEHAIELLRGIGIEEIGATLGYLPDEIQDYFGDGEQLGVKIRWYIENTPLGTAGSVYQARDFLTERFVVLSGDGITDFDLAAAIRFHEKNDALATLILCRCANPQEYGMVVTDGEGRIRSFHEKPGRCDLYSDRINTGIYILEPEVLRHIPHDRAYDFGHELFPALLAEGAAIYGYTAKGYWCDVGDISAYLRVHSDAMDGRIGTGLSARISPDAVLEQGCCIEAPCHIAAGAHICAGAVVGPYAVIGAGSTICPGASVKHSVLFDHVHVSPGAQLRGCVACAGAAIGEGARLFEESALGSRASVGCRAVLGQGVKLWPEKAIPDGERPDANIVWGSRREQRFIGGSLLMDNPAQASRAAGAICAHMQPGELLVGRGNSAVASAMWHAVCAGAMAQGTQVIDAGVCALPQLRHALKNLRSGAALLVEEDNITPLNSTGAPLTEKQQRSILKLMERQDYASPFSTLTRPVLSAGRTDLGYIASAAACFSADPALAPAVLICCQNNQMLRLAGEAFARVGLRARCEWRENGLRPAAGELCFFLSANGEAAIPGDMNGCLDDAQCQLARAWTILRNGATRLILPLSATRGIEVMAKRYGAHAVYPSGERAAWLNALAEKDRQQFILQADALFFSLRFLSLLVEDGLSLDQWKAGLPGVYRSARMVRMPMRESSRVLRSLAEEDPDAELGGGLRLTRENGWAWLSPDESGSLQIIAEGRDMEAAKGMCDFYEGELERLLAKED